MSHKNCWTIDLASHIAYLTGDTDCRVKVLTGDIERTGAGMGNITIGLAGAIRSQTSRVGSRPSGSSTSSTSGVIFAERRCRKRAAFTGCLWLWRVPQTHWAPDPRRIQTGANTAQFIGWAQG